MTLKELKALRLDVRAQTLDVVASFRDEVALVCDDYLRTGRQIGAVLGKLGVYGVKVRNGVSALAAADVNDMHDEAHPFDVAKEIVSEPRALACALDKPGDIRNNKAVVIHLHDAKIRTDRREMIVGDLWFCACQNGQKRGFSDVRKTDESDVRDGFEFERNLMLFRRFAQLRE